MLNNIVNNCEQCSTMLLQYCYLFLSTLQQVDDFYACSIQVYLRCLQTTDWINFRDMDDSS